MARLATNSIPDRRVTSGRPPWRAIALVLLAAASAGGCVTRRLTVRSNPPGATVYLDDREIGVTPISTNYIYYGKRKFRLVKDGYETLTRLESVPPPWYEIPPLDFVSENLVPGEIRDQRTITFNLQPQRNVQPVELRTRAEELRNRSRILAPTPAPTAADILPPGALEPVPSFPPPERVGEPMRSGLPPNTLFSPPASAASPPG